MGELDRKTQKLLHTKQDKFLVKLGAISLGELIEGNPAVSYISGKGLYLVTKYNNQMYYIKWTQGAPS